VQQKVAGEIRIHAYISYICEIFISKYIHLDLYLSLNSYAYIYLYACIHYSQETQAKHRKWRGKSIYMFIYHTCIHVFTYINIPACIYVYVYAFVHVHVYTSIYTFIHTLICICMKICICICIRIYLFIHNINRRKT